MFKGKRLLILGIVFLIVSVVGTGVLAAVIVNKNVASTATVTVVPAGGGGGGGGAVYDFAVSPATLDFTADISPDGQAVMVQTLTVTNDASAEDITALTVDTTDLDGAWSLVIDTSALTFPMIGGASGDITVTLTSPVLTETTSEPGGFTINLNAAY